jgi:hypothetical protein
VLQQAGRALRSARDAAAAPTVAQVCATVACHPSNATVVPLLVPQIGQGWPEMLGHVPRWRRVVSVYGDVSGSALLP